MPLPPRPFRLVAPWAAALLLLAATAGDGRCDIYQWVDDQGVLHFTDDPGTIPEGRQKESRVFLKERPLPPAAEGPLTVAPPPPPSVPPAAGPPPDSSAGAQGDRLRLEAEQLRAKIIAKEELVKAVEAKRSLALDATRNRIVDPEDMELYRKYQEDLPADRARLRDLEERLR